MTQPVEAGPRIIRVTETASTYVGPDYFIQTPLGTWAHWPAGRWDPDQCDRCNGACGGKAAGCFVSRECLVLCDDCGPKRGGDGVG